MRKIFFLFLLCLFLLSAPSQAAYVDPRLDWETLQTTHFNIHYYNQEREIAKKLAPIAEKTHEKLSAKFKWEPWGKTEVVLVDSTDIANGFATVLPYNYILLFLTAPEADSFLNNYDDWLEDLFTHEYTHILHMDQYGGIATPFHWLFGKIVAPNGLTPAWVREGIAVYQESENGKGRANNPYVDMVLRTDILNKKFLHIDEAANFKIDWPNDSAGYLYGGAFWTYLAQSYGDEKIQEFMKRYGDSLWLFSLNHKARRTFENKNFFTLWQEWKKSLEEKYSKQKELIEKTPLTETETLFKQNGKVSALTLSPDSSKLAYVKNNLDGPPEIHLRELASGKDIILAKQKVSDSLHFSPDGKKLLFTAITNYKLYNFYKDIYELDTESKKIKRLTKGQRITFASYHPQNGKILAVKSKTASSELVLFNPAENSFEQITQSEPYVLYSYPHFSPDGKYIVTTMMKEGSRNIYLLSADGKKSIALTQENSNKNDSHFTKDGKSILFTSDEGDENGLRIPNLFKIDLSKEILNFKKESKIHQLKLSNVLSGLFYAQDAEDGNIYALLYSGQGFEGIRFQPESISQKVKAKTTNTNTVIESSSNTETPSKTSFTERRYNPFNKFFLPRYLIPGLYFDNGSPTFTAGTGSNDPLGWHFWNGNAVYRSDLNFLGGDFNYTYNRLKLPVSFGFSDYLNNYGDIFYLNKDYNEERRRAYVATEMRLGPKHKLSGYYTFESRRDASDLPSTYANRLNLGKYAGVGLTYRFNNTKKYPLSLGREEGPLLKLNFEYLDHLLGSSESNETKILEADLRYYLKIPKAPRHILALRAAGGINFGDKLYQGVFRLGSAIGESFLTPVSNKLYTLRGLPQVTFAGDRALLFSGEYRLPLLRVDRGIGTAPVYLKDLHLAVFGDVGTVFDNEPRWDEFLVGVGTEIRGDFMLGYGLPLSARLGYGIIVKGRKYLGSLEDPITKASIKNGTVILQVGTSF